MTIVRDRFNVPHITGKTRDDVTWATGWVLEEDRGLLLAQARYPAPLAALDAPGIDAFGLVTGLKPYRRPSRPTASSRSEQTAALQRGGQAGQGACCTTSTSTCRASTRA